MYSGTWALGNLGTQGTRALGHSRHFIWQTPSTFVKSDMKNPVACISTCLSHGVLSMCILPIDVYCDKTKSQVQTYAMLDNCRQGTFIKGTLM